MDRIDRSTLLDARAAAAYLGIRPSSLYRLGPQGLLAPHKQANGRVYFRKADLDHRLATRWQHRP